MKMNRRKRKKKMETTRTTHTHTENKTIGKKLSNSNFNSKWLTTTTKQNYKVNNANMGMSKFLFKTENLWLVKLFTE